MSAVIAILSLACFAAALRILSLSKRYNRQAQQILDDANSTYARAVEEGEQALQRHRDALTLLEELQ